MEWPPTPAIRTSRCTVCGTVATTLVAGGDILAAQYRLGHADASTTLRTYSHALPLQDGDAAAILDAPYQQ